VSPLLAHSPSARHTGRDTAYTARVRPRCFTSHWCLATPACGTSLLASASSPFEALCRCVLSASMPRVSRFRVNPLPPTATRLHHSVPLRRHAGARTHRHPPAVLPPTSNSSDRRASAPSPRRRSDAPTPPCGIASYVHIYLTVGFPLRRHAGARTHRHPPAVLPPTGMATVIQLLYRLLVLWGVWSRRLFGPPPPRDRCELIYIQHTRPISHPKERLGFTPVL